ncbi:MAG: hypothetical protein QXF82_08775 [Nitrososphaeria archaeon]
MERSINLWPFLFFLRGTKIDPVSLLFFAKFKIFNYFSFLFYYIAVLLRSESEPPKGTIAEYYRSRFKQNMASKKMQGEDFDCFTYEIYLAGGPIKFLKFDCLDCANKLIAEHYYDKSKGIENFLKLCKQIVNK